MHRYVFHLTCVGVSCCYIRRCMSHLARRAALLRPQTQLIGRNCYRRLQPAGEVMGYHFGPQARH